MFLSENKSRNWLSLMNRIALFMFYLFFLACYLPISFLQIFLLLLLKFALGIKFLKFICVKIGKIFLSNFTSGIVFLRSRSLRDAVQLSETCKKKLIHKRHGFIWNFFLNISRYLLHFFPPTKIIKFRCRNGNNNINNNKKN